MIFFSTRSLFFFLIVGTLISCHSQGPANVIEMEFNVDSSIVDKRESDSSLQIDYAVPSGWQPVTATPEALQQVQTGNIQVRKILKNQPGTVVFSLTDVRKVPDSTFENMDKNFRSILNPSGTWQSIERAEFITGGFSVKQYVMSRQGQTFFKMFFGNRKRPEFQIDYSILIDSAYALNTKTLESIVGSLKRAH